MSTYTKDRDLGYRRILGELKKLEKKPYVKVGLQEASKKSGKFTMPQLGAVHEFGTNIRVTPKQRNYLRFIGLPLLASTEFIRIPQRSFIRSTHDENKDKWTRLTKQLQSDIYRGTQTVKTALQKIGVQIQSDIRNKIVDIKDPPNHPFTIMRKKSDNPLVDNGILHGEIREKVVMR